MNKLNAWLAGTFFLFVISIMISQSAMDAFGTLSCILLIVIWFLSKKDFRLFPTIKMEIPFLFFAGAVVLSFLTNWETQKLFLERTIELKWIIHFYLIVSILRYLKPGYKSLEWVQVIVAISAVFALLAPLLGYDLLRGINAEIDRTPSGIARAGGFFSNPMTFSHLHSVFFFFLVGLSLKFLNRKNQQAYKTVALTILLGMAIFLSFTRGVWLGVFIGLIVTGFMFNRRWGLLILISSIALAALGVSFVPAIQDRALQVFSSTSYDSERLWLWKAHWQIFLDHPLFGIGYGESKAVLAKYYQEVGAPTGLIISHAHNQFLNILASLGLFGFFAYLWMVGQFLISACRTYWKARESQAELWIQGLLLGAIGAQVSFLAGGFTESNFEHSKVRYALMLAWAIPFWIRAVLKKDPKGRS